MKTKRLIEAWFGKWEMGDFMNLPVTADFTHTSPFGKIEGKETYLALVKKNKDKFLGYKFQIHDGLFESQKACVRYTAIQGKGFKLDVSEWYYFRDDLIAEIVAYYHIGEIREERALSK
ncbi:MAG: nuclear transport factor 2 family protein [Saprospiraceae bacterium]|nr:nuclear transport factor 2 family protein [Saprospiraceae bacterium]